MKGYDQNAMPCGSDFCIFFQKIQKFKKRLDDITVNVIHCIT